MDQLEKYIQQNRDQFDDRNPDPGLWAGIEARLPRRTARRVAVWKMIAAAAVGLVLVLSGVVAGLRMNHPDFVDTAEFREFREAERYYSGQFNQQLMKLSDHDYDPALDADIKELSAIYEELTVELMEGLHPDKQEVIEALIMNYQTRVDLLERVLQRLDEGKQRMQNIDDDETTQM